MKFWKRKEYLLALQIYFFFIFEEPVFLYKNINLYNKHKYLFTILLCLKNTGSSNINIYYYHYYFDHIISADGGTICVMTCSL